MHHTARKSDKWIPWYFVAFFVVVAIVNVVFVITAIRTNNGVVTKQAYEKGLHYNHTIEEAEQQAQAGWQGTIQFHPPQLSFRLEDNQQKGIDGAQVKAYFFRQTQAGYDFSVPLPYQDNGVYGNIISFPLPGQWNVRIVAQWNGKQYQQSKLIIAE